MGCGLSPLLWPVMPFFQPAIRRNLTGIGQSQRDNPATTGTPDLPRATIFQKF